MSLRVLLIDPAPTRRALARRAIMRVSELIEVAESSDPTSVATAAAESVPDVIVTPAALVKRVGAAWATRELDVTLLSVAAGTRDTEGAFALLSEDDLARASHDDASAARIAQAVRRASWCTALERLASAEARAHARAALTRPLRVLHVEDSPAAVAYVRHVLRRSNIELVVCPQVRDALDLAKRETFDAALLDSQLPDGTGAGVARALSQISPALAAIGLTSILEPGGERDLFAAGAWAYLEKHDAFVAGLELAVRQSVRMALLWAHIAASTTGAVLRPDLTTLPRTTT